MKSSRSTAEGMLGAVATLLLHSLFFTAAMWGGKAAQRLPDRPDAIGAGANRGRPEGDSAERRMAVQLLMEDTSQRLLIPPDAYLDELAQRALKLEITGPDAQPLPPLVSSENGVPAESNDAEIMARTTMVGIYESQIRARIERAWSLPDEFAPDGEKYTCRALIRQQRDGRIIEVELPYDGCDAPPALRQSLITAIFTASPLPAPPHVGVFVDSFSLVFRPESVLRDPVASR